MFQSLSDKLESAFKQIKGEGRITELNIAATVKDIRRALIDADVNYKIAKEFTDTIREKALGQKVLTAVSPGQLMVKIVKDELVELIDRIDEAMHRLLMDRGEIIERLLQRVLGRAARVSLLHQRGVGGRARLRFIQQLFARLAQLRLANVACRGLGVADLFLVLRDLCAGLGDL